MWEACSSALEGMQPQLGAADGGDIAAGARADDDHVVACHWVILLGFGTSARRRYSVCVASVGEGARPLLPRAGPGQFTPEYFGKDEAHVRATSSISTVARNPAAQI